MSRYPLSEMVQEYIDRWPGLGSMTVAKMIHGKLQPGIATIEQIRSKVRYLRGASGSERRDDLRPEAVALEAERKAARDKAPKQFTVPHAVRPADVSPFSVDFNTALVLSDVHIPYHDAAAVSAAVEYGKSASVDAVVLNGDIFDFYTLSSFYKDPRQRNLPLEIERGRAFLIAIREAFPDASIVFKLGNHEERWQRHLGIKAPELIGVEDFEIGKVYGCDDLDITVLDRMRHVRLGKVNVVHGHEFFGSSRSGGVNPARTLFMQSNDTSLCGHWHRTTSHSDKSMSGKVTSCWSTGCLCDMHPEFARYNKWNHGFAVVDRGSDDSLGAVSNLKIIDGKVIG